MVRDRTGPGGGARGRPGFSGCGRLSGARADPDRHASPQAEHTGTTARDARDATSRAALDRAGAGRNAGPGIYPRPTVGAARGADSRAND